MARLICEDWEQTERDFHSVFEDVTEFDPDSQIDGSNFMTPDVLGVFRYGDVLVELSTGIMPMFGERPRRNHRVFAVTVRRPAVGGIEGNGSDLSHLIDYEAIESMEDLRKYFDGFVEQFSAVS